MKKHLFLTTILAVALTSQFAAAQPTEVSKLQYPALNQLEIPKVEKTTLDNGLRLYLTEDHELPTFRVSVRINCGAYLEPTDKIGMVDILGEVLRTGGTTKWTGDQLDEMLEGIGGSVETSGGITEISAGVRVLSENTDLGLEVLAEILRRPVFNQDKIDLAKVGERTAISRRNDQPRQVASREFFKIIYGRESPYARHSEYATIDAITRNDLVNFHETWFHPEIVQMAICGDFDSKAMLKSMRKLFGDWNRGTTTVPPPPPVDYSFAPGVYLIEKPDVNQSQIYLGHIGGLIMDPDYPARIVMNTIMGGGSGSRMFDVVRSREGLAYTASSSYSANFDVPGVFTNYAATKSQSTGKAIREMIKVIQSMQSEPPTDQELRYGRDSYLNSFVFQFDTPDKVVNRIMNYDYFGLTEDFLLQVRNRVEQVTAEDVVAAAKMNLRPDALRILVVGKPADFDIPLDSLGLGPVHTIDIAIPSSEAALDPPKTIDDVSKGRTLLAQAVAAHGGLDRFKDVHSLSFKGTMTLILGGDEMQMQLETVRVLPDKSRSVIEFMGKKMYDVTNGTNGWKTDRMSGEFVAKSAEELKEEIRDRNRGLMFIFQRSEDLSLEVVYDGSDTASGTPVEYVALLRPDGTRLCRLGIQSDTHFLLNQSYWGKTPVGEGTITESFIEWREVKGIRLPVRITRSMNGRVFSTSVYTEILVNPEIPTEMFEKP